MNYENDFGSGPQLDLNTSDMSWGSAPVRNPRSLGNKIISTPETTVENPVSNQDQEVGPFASETAKHHQAVHQETTHRSHEHFRENPNPEIPSFGRPKEPELGKIIPLYPETGSQTNPNSPQSFDRSIPTINGDRLSKETMIEIDKLEKRLNQNHLASDFYEEVRDMNSATMLNAFSRNVYGSQDSTPGTDKIVAPKNTSDRQTLNSFRKAA